uniref:Putative secreted protein n=1 Tax=Ixodes ricinus TaxID=34613 RepID=A0A6B0V244_IXORI
MLPSASGSSASARCSSSFWLSSSAFCACFTRMSSETCCIEAVSSFSCPSSWTMTSEMLSSCACISFTLASASSSEVRFGSSGLAPSPAACLVSSSFVNCSFSARVNLEPLVRAASSSKLSEDSSLDTSTLDWSVERSDCWNASAILFWTRSFFRCLCSCCSPFDNKPAWCKSASWSCWEAMAAALNSNTEGARLLLS